MIVEMGILNLVAVWQSPRKPDISPAATGKRAKSYTHKYFTCFGQGAGRGNYVTPKSLAVVFEILES